MSRAFVKETDAGSETPERPISPHHNYVTAEGLRQIEAQISRLDAELANLDAEAREPVARELRYWMARRATADLVPLQADHETVRFGSTVTLSNEHGDTRMWRIVGEDEADPTLGSVSYSSPLAKALIGKAIGDAVRIGDREWEIGEVG